MASGGQALVAALEALGVQVAFGLPGVHNLAAWRAFPGSAVRLVGVRHEQSAGYAADGYARATGRLGVALTTTGPGAANVVTATGEAWACHSPLLVIATDIPTGLRRPGVYRGVLHETTDQAAFFGPVTKAQLRVEHVEQLFDAVLAAGMAACTAPRRPVYLEIPTDVLSAQVEVPAVSAHWQAMWEMPPELTARRPQAAALAERLRALARPLVWAGGGVTGSDTGQRVSRLARLLGAPVLTSYGGRGCLDPDDPSLVPLPPHDPAAGALWDDADGVLVLGSDLDAMNTQGFRQPRPPWVATIDLATPVNLEPDVHLPWALPGALDLLLGHLGQEQAAPWWERPVRVLPAAEGAFLAALESALPPDAVLVADMCVPGYWFGGYGRVGAPRGLAYPVGWGTLGFGFPAGLGAALSGRPAVALVGDGGFLFACGDLATAAQEQLPLTVVLVDDGGYGMLAYDFTKDGQTPVGCDLQPPDFLALSHAFRVPAVQVDVSGLADAVRAGIASGGPNLVVLRASYQPPPTTSPRWYRAAPGR